MQKQTTNEPKQTMSNEDKDESNGLIMAKNGLMYKMPQSLSTTVNRTFKREYAQRNAYNAGDTIVFDWNTGTAYVDPANAMLTFDVTVDFAANVDAAEVVSFGSGAGACSLIEEIRIISKNGTELDRIQNANILAKIMADWTYDTDGNKYLQMALKGRTFAAPADNRTLKAVIPLKLISGFFRPTVRDMLIPAGLASGVRVEITLAQPSRVLHRSAGPGTGLTYSISDPEMLLMLHDLNDTTQGVLMSESANNGLEYTFPSYFSTTLNTVQTSVNEQVKKAVSQCTRVFPTIFDVSGVNSVSLETKDGFATVSSDQLVNFQYRVGSSYYPQNLVGDEIEAWYIANSTFCQQASVNFAEYSTGSKILLGVPLQTHDKLNLSGLPINNSSVLELRLNLRNGAGLSRELVLIMEYITVARTFVNKTDIKI